MLIYIVLRFQQSHVHSLQTFNHLHLFPIMSVCFSLYIALGVSSCCRLYAHLLLRLPSSDVPVELCLFWIGSEFTLCQSLWLPQFFCLFLILCLFRYFCLSLFSWQFLLLHPKVTFIPLSLSRDSWPEILVHLLLT